MQQDGSSGLVQFNVSPSASSGLCLFGMLGAHGAAGTVFNYQWQLDTRSVTIVCKPPENGDNFHKGANDLPIANVRNSDGSMTIDTIPTKLNTVAKTWEFAQWLNAPTTGFDVDTTDKWLNLVNTSFDWTVDGLGFGSVATTATDGSFDQLPTTTYPHVKVTDLRPNLSATAENDYTIHIHSPFENVIQTAPTVFDHFDRYPWTTPSVIGGSSVTVLMVSKMPRTWSIMGQSANNVIGSTLAGVCGSGLYIFFAPEGSTVVAALADMIFNVVGWIVMNSGTPEPTATKGVEGSYATFLQAIADQKNHGQPAKSLYK